MAFMPFRLPTQPTWPGMPTLNSASRGNIESTAVILTGFMFDVITDSSSSYAQEIEIPQQAN